MSSYIAFDLDAFPRAQAAARAARVSEDAVFGGLLRMWEHCWRAKTARLQTLQLAGFFLTEIDLRPVLMAFGFLEADGDAVRVKGADRYLRLTEARAKGGRKASENGNLKRGTAAGKQPQLTVAQPQLVPSSTPADSQLSEHSPPGLTSSIEHRASNIEHRDEEAVAAPVPVPLPSKPSDDERAATAEAYFRWLQNERAEAGYVIEKPPRGWANAWREMLLYLGGDLERLDATVGAFAVDPYWAGRGAPIQAFMSQWQKYVPRKSVAS